MQHLVDTEIFSMNHEKRTLLALIIAFIFCAVWVQMMQEKHRKWAEEQQKLQQAEKPKPGAEGKPETPTPQAQPQTPEVKKPEPLPLPPPIAGPFAAEKEETVIISTQKCHTVWTNRGAALISLKLKEFYHSYVDRTEKDWQQKSENWLELIPQFTQMYRTFALMQEEMVVQDSQVVKLPLNDLLWKVSQSSKDQEKQLVFELGPIGGIVYRKIFTFQEGNAYFDAKLVIENQGTTQCARQINLVAGIGIELESLDPSEAYRSFYTYAMYPNSKGQPLFEDFDYNEFSKAQVKLEQNVTWVSLVNRYFSYILHLRQAEGLMKIANLEGKLFAPEPRWIKEVVGLRKAWRETVQEADLQKLQLPMLILNSEPVELKPQTSAALEFTYYLGTKDQLSNLDKTYHVVDDYGFFGFISRLLLWIMGFFYNIFHNYGIAIICLTLVVKACLFPLTKKQQVSMAKYQKQMKVFQPQLRKLQEKYKDDKQKMNQEVMKLYKEHGINPLPLGGCLPIFLQLPIFIGLYQALYYSIDLRQASFLWITDLSQPDHLINFGTYVMWLGDYLNILPIIMTVVWMIQQKMTPKPEDPQMQQQQKVFMYMTVFFGFMFYHIAAGLVLYWMVMNLFGIVEQMIIKKHIPTDATPATAR